MWWSRESPRITGTIWATFGKPLQPSGPQFLFLQQVHIEPDDSCNFFGKQWGAVGITCSGVRPVRPVRILAGTVWPRLSHATSLRLYFYFREMGWDVYLQGSLRGLDWLKHGQLSEKAFPQGQNWWGGCFEGGCEWPGWGKPGPGWVWGFDWPLSREEEMK